MNAVNLNICHNNRHYEHRRLLKAKKQVLNEGKFVGLNAEHDFGWFDKIKH